MTDSIPLSIVPGKKQLGGDKTKRNRAGFDTNVPTLRKPDWIRVRLPVGNAVAKLKKKISNNALVTVCEEASCPNIHECFNKGTATFMILGEVCTRRCSFCDVAHGRPLPVDVNEPANLAKTIAEMGLRYVVITSVDRDDLKDGGAQHYVDCIKAVREACPNIKIEILTPDYRGKGRMDVALDILAQELPDVFNHNLETVPRLYKKSRPGSDYQWSLDLIKKFKAMHPSLPTKSGLMLGLGEEIEEVKEVMRDLRAHNCDMLTLGQYLQPSLDHLPVERFVTPDEFKELEIAGYEMGFSHVASGPMVRSSYFADEQASGLINSAVLK